VPLSLRSLAVVASAAVATTGATLAALAVPAVAHAGIAAAQAGRTAPASKPGPQHRPILLQDHAEFSGYDAATDAAGTTYIGWISDTGSGRKVHLCTLPRRAVACQGGISTISSLDTITSSAQGLHVLVTSTGHVTLVWMHDTTASENGPQGSEIADATASNGGPLGAPADVATAPSFGTMEDAAVGPGGAIWVVTETSALTTLQVRPGITAAPVSLKPPYEVGNAQLAFAGSTAVLAIQQAGAITHPVAYASHKTSWSGFKNLGRTWTSDANLGLTGTRSGVRLLASVSNADYWPVVSRWTGSGFTRPALTGDRNNCSPSSHDPVSDASGRMADVSEECSNLAVANLTDTTHAAVVRFGSGGTFAGGIPQIATAPSGRSWVVWSIESSTANKLLAAPVLLPGRTVTVTAAKAGNRAILTGPASCLPAVTVGVRLRGSAARHWRVLRGSIRLGSKVLKSSLNGAGLTAGHLYTLAGTVTFADGSARRVVTARLRFRTCANP
jgi:hypothetical protein